MPDVLPRHAPGQAVTRTAGAAITAGQLVTITADKTVSPTSGAGAVEGQASADCASGGLVTVWAGGVVEVVTSADITAGQRVQSAAAGKVAPWAGSAAADVIGHCTTGAASGSKAGIRLYNA